ncbi:endolysin [Streptomyces phage Manuel]|uniref:Endolysin n=1 Tax=Streptomyces phage Manuel TaxID=2053812 RepID=A0A2H4PQW8_9CAUD|nr:endolysin [Streptomyces phage Manuel]ATW69320.1 endolysin [Streptomyces phage Manuel]
MKVHYEGTRVDCDTHAECVSLVKAIRKSHLANKVENYSDIAYNLIVCKHGYVFEGRGKRKRTGANGNQALNQAHYAVMGLLGSSGDTEPTDEMVEGIKDAIAYLRSNGAGKEIKGHRDGYATACPGGPLYKLVKSGKLEPGTAVTAKPKPVYAPFPGKGFFRLGQKHDLITELGKALVRAGWKGYKVGPGREFTRTDIKAVAWFQRKQGWSGSDADGYPGPETWKRLKVAQPR